LYRALKKQGRHIYTKSGPIFITTTVTSGVVGWTYGHFVVARRIYIAKTFTQQ